VFERFTERARQVVVFAQDEARALGHDYIGTEHLLLGLLREEDGLGARVLAELGLTLEAARTQVLAIEGPGGAVEATGQIPFTPRGKHALELSLREALALGHNYIGTEHLLLGLLREGEGVASKVLHALGLEEEQVRARVVGLLGGAAVISVAVGGRSRGRTRWPREEDLPGMRRRVSAGRAGYTRLAQASTASSAWLLVTGWLLFALALGAGILVGWAIWGSA
jgi:ATP-dependent Clp protease ATP-binding subunit ClpC